MYRDFSHRGRGKKELGCKWRGEEFNMNLRGNFFVPLHKDKGTWNRLPKVVVEAGTIAFKKHVHWMERFKIRAKQTIEFRWGMLDSTNEFVSWHASMLQEFTATQHEWWPWHVAICYYTSKNTWHAIKKIIKGDFLCCWILILLLWCFLIWYPRLGMLLF